MTAYISAYCYAETVSGLYTAKVDLNTNDSSELAANSKQVLQKGLERVLVKISGNSQIVNNPVISEAMKNPENYLQKFVKSKDNYSVQTYISRSLEDLFKQAGVPVWSRQRPVALLWLMIETNAQTRILLNETELNSDNVHYKNLINNYANSRALPVTYPLQDLEEQIALSPAIIWAQFSEDLKKASERYDVDVVVAARYKAEELSGQIQWQGKWLVMNNNQSDIEFVTQASELETSLQKGIDLLTDNLARIYTSPVVASLTDVNIRITGVDNLENYKSINKYLSRLSVIEQLKLTHLGAGWLGMTLKVKDGEKALLKSLSLDNKLVRTNNKIINHHIAIPNFDDELSDNNLVNNSTEVLQFRWRS